jgi:4-amino-4-deoxy-L-arabinose transferase-like glycosyltransferase
MSLPTSVSPSPGRAVRAARTFRGTPGDPAWARPALVALLAATAVLYIWGLGASKWANAFYSAAVQAGAHSWKAFFFGSSDAANFITVDKTPLALWPMDLAARLFGVNSWSILVPQALMGVATVGLLYTSVRRSLRPLGPRAAACGGLLAGAVLATTPIAALMFRYNNPDALLVLLLTAGAYALLRAQERASTRWLVVAASCVGLAFLAKMLQAFLVLPAFGLVYLAMAPASPRRRLWQLAVAAVVLIVSAGWWVAIVAAVPAASRPYIGGSQHNSVLELALGYNGIGRLTGYETGGLGNTNQDAGWMRMFGTELGGQISWLLPAALILLVAGLWAIAAGHVRRAAPAGTASAEREGAASTGREVTASEELTGDDDASEATRAARDAPGLRRTGAAAFLVWGGWLLVTGVVFSLMQGIFHGYYTVALAPPIAALTGLGGTVLWTGRRHPAATGALATVVVLTSWWSYRLLGRTPDFAPWLRLPVPTGGLIAAAGLLAGAWLSRRPSADPSRDDRGRPGPAGRVLVAGGVLAVTVSLAGPAAYAVDTASTAHNGAIPSAGPSGLGGGPFRGGQGGFRGAPRGRRDGGTRGGPGGFPGAGGGQGGMPQPPNGTGGTAGNGGTPGVGAPVGRGGGMPGGGPGGGTRRGGTGGPGALLDAPTPSAALTALLKQNAGRYTWAAAAVGSNNAAGYQLATGEPVMALGGFNGTDPAPTLARFQQYVREKKIHYFIATSLPMGGGRASSGSDDAQRIATWVAKTYTAKTVDGTTVYELG